MASPLNVTIVGASGSLGSRVLEKLLQSDRFKVQVIRRPSSTKTFPNEVHVVDAALDSPDVLTEALHGQDAVVSTLGVWQADQQRHLVDACIAAGVHRFLPAEYGADLENAKVQSLPAYKTHVKIREYIIEKSKTCELTYTFMHTGAFLDWGLEHDFILRISDYKPVLIDAGKPAFSATTLSSVADAIEGVLIHLNETKNRPVYIEDIKLSQALVFDLAKQVAPSKPWEATVVKLDDLTAEADQRVSDGKLDDQTLVPYLYCGLLDPDCGGAFATLDNELLGVKGKTIEDVKKMLRACVV
ncbi:hypothetical protein S40285_03319 [Stachybotrys chlorohalonatus IBT 40285]|uniref:NmrA-like domain-containing protein n=1 Tax=Stachybotrys chlorohalonatus (strain IBT 40285) TaxID=1283841 RepID=A0A084R1H7_STAC4|nr:hypothetical protein S40285_03319 [Stachybotrys chlorohalonata IBT 40285]